MQQLTREQATDELQRYLQDFQNQSGLDILSFCTVDKLVLPGNARFTECIPTDKKGFTTLNGRPVLLAQQEVMDNTSGRLLGTAVVGIWLEDTFLERLAAATGMQQSILLPDGLRLSSTFADTTLTTSMIPPPLGNLRRTKL